MKENLKESPLEKELDSKIDNFCVWYWKDCRKAMPQKHQYCTGIPKTSCFAYLSVSQLDKIEEKKKLDKLVDEKNSIEIKIGDYKK